MNSKPHSPNTHTASTNTPPWLGLSVLLLAGFVTIFDLFVVNVAIPNIQSQLGASFSQIGFIVAGYELAFGVLLITGGRLGDLFGRRKLFIIGMAGFTLASALCGLAPNAFFLIIARVLQGLAAALLFPQVYASIRVNFDGDNSRRAFGLLDELRDDGRLQRPPCRTLDQQTLRARQVAAAEQGGADDGEDTGFLPPIREPLLKESGKSVDQGTGKGSGPQNR